MNIEGAVQLVGSGNIGAAESKWLAVIESDDLSAASVSQLFPLLEALVEGRQKELAASLAWAAVEALKEKVSSESALTVAKPFLLALKEADELRNLTTQLYKDVYRDRPGLETLLDASGLNGSRPVRRALRTLEVCLAVQPGSFVAARHHDSAGQVDSIDIASWQIELTHDAQSETLDPVSFADEWEPCADDDFRIRHRFKLENLRKLAQSDPAQVILSLLRSEGRILNSDEIQKRLVPDVIPEPAWTKWWTKARSAVRRDPNIKLEGRSPYVLEYIAEGITFDIEFNRRFQRHRSAVERWSEIDAYLRQCRTQNQSPDETLLRQLKSAVIQHAEKSAKKSPAESFIDRLVESLIQQALAEPDAGRSACDLIRSSPDIRELFALCDALPQWSAAFDYLQMAKKTDWPDDMLDLMTVAPVNACDEIAKRLEAAEIPAERMQELTNDILSNATTSFEALCWLWDKGLSLPRWQCIPAGTLLTKLLWLLAEVSISDQISRDAAKRIRAVVRSALSARKYERFDQCVSEIEQGMGSAWLTQVKRLDGLGRSVQEDLINRIRDRFPGLYAQPKTPDWAKEDIIYSTAEGMSRWQAAIDELVNVKMKENAIAIGAAAEKGDLSENSEYKFALEERDLLRARLAHMQDQMAKARRLDPTEVPADHASMGSKVSFKNVEQGNCFEAIFLGPFEADVENAVFNYKSPIGQTVMGLRVGEHVDLPMANPPGKYEIVDLKKWTD